MTATPHFKLRLSPIIWFIILALITGGLALGLPPSPDTLSRLQISSWIYRIAVLALLIPYLVIWFTAFYAWDHLRSYTKFLKRSKEGSAFGLLAIGAGILAFGLVLPTAIGLVLSWANQNYSSTVLESVAQHFGTYSALLVAVAVFSIFGVGARRLAEFNRIRYKPSSLRIFILIFILLGVSFTYLVNHDTDLLRSHHLNSYLLLYTFTAPYLYAWYVGLFAALDLQMSARYVKGVLYQRALQLLSFGLGIVILGSIAIQFVNSTVSDDVLRSLWPLLTLEYVLLALVAVGMVLMALGAKKLQRIEEV